MARAEMDSPGLNRLSGESSQSTESPKRHLFRRRGFEGQFLAILQTAASDVLDGVEHQQCLNDALIGKGVRNQHHGFL